MHKAQPDGLREPRKARSATLYNISGTVLHR
jgi:hypothetical protein